MSLYTACPLCGSGSISLHIQTNDFFLTAEPFSLFRCRDCSFIFTQEHPAESEAGRYYASDQYLSHNDSAKGITSYLYRLSRDFMLGRKQKIIEKHTGLKSGSLLDIGCGTGHLLNKMKRKGWNVRGIEINRNAADYATKKFSLEIIDPKNISSLPSAGFDCITLWHVLEHFEDPYAYFSEISRMLKAGGTCITALPNCNSFDAGHYRKFWAAWDVPRHLWHFSPYTFQIFARKSGFELIKVRSLPLDVFYISILSEKYRGSRLHFLTGAIMGKWFWFRSMFDLKRSSSLVYILRKKA